MAKLKKEGENCYLTWYHRDEKKYMLSVCWDGVVKHFKVEVNYNYPVIEYKIEGTERPYKDFYQLLNFFREYPLDRVIKGIGYYLEIGNTAPILPNLPKKKKNPNSMAATIPKHEAKKKQSSLSRTLSSRGIPSWTLDIMKKHPSFHGNMKSSEAESKLNIQGGNCYLTRYSKSQKKLRISVQKTRGETTTTKHFSLSIEKGSGGIYSVEIEGTEEKFNDICKLLKHYEKQPIDNIMDGLGQYIETTEHTPSFQPTTTPSPQPSAYSCDVDYPQTQTRPLKDLTLTKFTQHTPKSPPRPVQCKCTNACTVGLLSVRHATG